MSLLLARIQARHSLPTGAILHLVAADLALADGATIATWTDRVASHQYTQATASKRPLYVASAINGLPAVRGNPTNGTILVGPALGFAGNPAYTLLAICARNGNPGSSTPVERLFHIGRGPSGGNLQSVGFEVSEPSSVGGSGFRFNGGNHVFQETISVPACSSWIVSAGQTLVDSRWRMNGVAGTQLLADNGSASVSLVDDGSWVLAGFNTVGAETDHVNIDLAEMVMYDRALSDVELQQAERALMRKYAIS